MAWIKIINENEAEGKLAKMYKKLTEPVKDLRGKSTGKDFAKQNLQEDDFAKQNLQEDDFAKQNLRGGVDEIMKIHSLNPPSLDAHFILYKCLMRGRSPLTKIQREMIAVTVSAANGCHY